MLSAGLSYITHCLLEVCFVLYSENPKRSFAVCMRFSRLVTCVRVGLYRADACGQNMRTDENANTLLSLATPKPSQGSLVRRLQTLIRSKLGMGCLARVPRPGKHERVMPVMNVNSCRRGPELRARIICLWTCLEIRIMSSTFTGR